MNQSRPENTQGMMAMQYDLHLESADKKWQEHGPLSTDG